MWKIEESSVIKTIKKKDDCKLCVCLHSAKDLFSLPTQLSFSFLFPNHIVFY